MHVVWTSPTTFIVGILFLIFFNVWSEVSDAEMDGKQKVMPFALMFAGLSIEYFSNGLVFQKLTSTYQAVGLSLAWWLLVYVLVGYFIWSPIRYFIFLKDRIKWIKENKDENRWNLLIEELKNDMHPKKQKSRISSWALFWPADFAWQLTKNPTKYVYKLLYSMVSKIFLKIHKRVFA